MSLITLVGVWSLAFGHITLTPGMKLKGVDARIFGLLLILVAAYAYPHLSGFVGGFTPALVSANEAFKSAFELLTGALAVYVTAWIVTRVLPKLHIPRVTISMKRQRA